MIRQRGELGMAMFLLSEAVFFFLLILVLLVTFAWKYRYREGQPMLDAPKHNTALELTWTFIPTLIVIVIFFYGFKGYLQLAVPPPDSYEVDVTARMWSYSFRYPNGEQSNELHIPINTPVVFVLSSDDVLHGFYMPIFRIKKDVVPGRYNKIWVQATMPGTFDIFCTQYCGQDHSSMRNHVVVQSRADFIEWLGKLGGGSLPPVERGKYLWVLARQSGGEWKIVSDCWSSDLTLTTMESDAPQGAAIRTSQPRKS